MLWFYEALLGALIFALAIVPFKLNHRDKLPNASFFFYLYSIGILPLVAYIVATDGFDTSVETIIGGAVVGLGSSVGNALYLNALRHGPLSLTSPIININVVFLVLGAVLFYGEVLSLWQTVLIALIVLAVLILPIDPDEDLRIDKSIWYWMVILASLFLAVRNGGLKVTEELGLNNHSVLFYGYAFSAIGYFFLKPRRYVQERKSVIYGASAGILSVTGMVLYASALAGGPASIVIPAFSVYNVLVVFLGYLIFREKLSAIQWVSVIVAIIAVTLLQG